MFDKDKLDKLKAKQAKWEQQHRQDFESERKKDFLTSDGIPIKRVYTPLDLEEKHFDYLNDLGLPGEFPFTRGVTPCGYRERPFLVQQQAGASTVEDSNKLHKALLAAGNDEMLLSFDTPTKLGFDSDNPLVKGEVGRAGIACDSLADIEVLVDEIDITKTRILFTCIPVTAVILAFFVAAGEKRGISPEKQLLFLQNDILQAYLAMDEYIFPPAHGMRLGVDAATYIAQHMPRGRAVAVCSYHLSEAGANRIQEAAIALSAAVAYVKAAVNRGIGVDLIAPRIGVQGVVRHRGILEEIAKIRAMRRIWARIIKDDFGARKPESAAILVHTGTGGTDMTRDDVDMNIVRGGIASFGAALAGARSVTGCTYDEPLGIPSKEAIETGIRTRYLIADECGVMDTVDPLGGSYYIEYLTSEIEDRVRKYMQRIDDMGGIMEAIASGALRSEIVANAFQVQSQIEKGERTVIGVNKFASSQSRKRLTQYVPITRKDTSTVEAQQAAKLKKLRETRDNEKVKRCLAEIKVMAAKEESEANNLMYPILEAARAYATLGEIVGTLKDVFGTYHARSAI